jgi:type IV fimbrial biogenesis protein FimT
MKQYETEETQDMTNNLQAIHTHGVTPAGFIRMRAAKGFTLIELLVTIAIAAILMALAVPSFQAMVMNNRLTAQAGALNTALNYARNTALSQAVPVAVCPVGTAGSTTCGASWAAGWMVVSNPAGAATLLQSQQAPSSGSTVLSSPVTSVLFGPRGLATTLSSFKVCDSRGAAFARSVQVFATGFVQAGATPGQVAWGTTALTCP